MPVTIDARTKHHYKRVPIGYAGAVEIQAACLNWKDINEHVARTGIGERYECNADLLCQKMIPGSALPTLIAAF